MRFYLKFSKFRKVYIFFCFLALLNIFFSTGITHAKNFAITDIEISTPFEINFNKNEIIDDGFIKAFDQLILSITQTKDQKKLLGTPLPLIKGMIKTFSIKEEKFIDEMYYLNLNVTFNKKKIFSLLEKKNIFPSQPIKKDIFFLPIIIDENKNEIQIFSESNLYSGWNLNNQKFHLLNYIMPTDDLEDFNNIRKKFNNLENYDFMEIIGKYNLENYIIMIAYINNKDVRVLNKINLFGEVDLKNLIFQNLNFDNIENIEKFIEKLKEIYENYWKSKNQINTSVKLALKISINNNDNIKISEFEEIINNIDLVYDFNIFKFDNKKNIYKIIFNGSPDNFLEIMKNKSYDFDTQNQIWTLK